jgi:hypothetical protein
MDGICILFENRQVYEVLIVVHHISIIHASTRHKTICTIYSDVGMHKVKSLWLYVESTGGATLWLGSQLTTCLFAMQATNHAKNY